MNRKKLTLSIGVIAAVLALSLTAFAALHVAVMPANAIVSHGTTQSVTLDAFCSFTPCDIQWTAILSDNNVGSIDNTSGPKTTFTAGTTPGSAVIFATEVNSGVKSQSTVTVQ